MREQTQIEKCVWNLSCYIVEAPIPKQCKTILLLLLLLLLLLCIDKKKVIITRLCVHKTSCLQEVVNH